MKGTKVTWTSTSNGATVTKYGTIVRQVLDGSIYPVIPANVGYAKFIHQHTPIRGDRYLIRVDRVGMTGKQLRPWFYLPRCSAVYVCAD